jgi:hypothetical protein
MTVRKGISLATLAFAVASGLALFACFDVFHSTADILTACEIDASRPGCTAAVGETNFCAWSHDEASRHALHACAWLGACESPIGNNAFGACYFRALLAYDCAANPNHQAKGAAHRLWDCLQQVETCGDVDACIFGDAAPSVCGTQGLYTGCATGNPDIRVLCTDGGVSPFARAVGAENCALWGQTCAPTSSGRAACAGEPTGSACASQPSSKCDRTSLHWCAAADDGGIPVDRGITCASNGAMDCGTYPGTDLPLWLACKPESDGAACEPDASAVCNEGRAIMCPSGVTEALDCAALLGSPSACSAGALSPPFDWTSPCSLTSACAADSCDGEKLTSCERGATFSMSCASQGLSACRVLTADLESTARAACGPPLP